ncbi:endonuclease domain-containing protein [Rathayibacter sp. KR2-224]|uniref:endonuclease domain-containing protein n=1 Tax=Rathayibacter sp. KR2-224 TaxID=3400913 RepID=UPI003C084947
MRRSSIPPELGRIFTSAAARDAGVAASRLRARDLDSPFHGVRAIPLPDKADSVELHVEELARRYAARMAEHEFFSHLTAATIWRLPLPPGSLDPNVVHVSVVAPRRAPRARGVVRHQARAASTTVCEHPDSGLRVSSPASTWASVAAILVHPYDVVAVADAVARVPRMPGGFSRAPASPLGTIAELHDAANSGRRVGGAALRAALPLVRTGASSRPETWTRLTLVAAGLPEPELDHDVFDSHGTFLACVDMAYPALRVAIEYEGDHHRSDPAQWAKDVDRIDRLAERGWRVIRVTPRLLFRHPEELVGGCARPATQRGSPRRRRRPGQRASRPLESRAFVLPFRCHKTWVRRRRTRIL